MRKLNRREVIKLGAVAAAGAARPAGVFGCAGAQWRDSISEVWRPIGRPTEQHDIMLELVRLATLAANSHNSQPWRFRLEENRIWIFPDFRRRLPVVDSDDHHLYASLGCAAENIVQAAPAFGLVATVEYMESPSPGRIRVALSRGPQERSPNLEAIHRRQCSRSVYDGKRLERSALAQLAAAASPAVSIDLMTDSAKLDKIANLIVQGNTAQVNDDGFRAELKSWLRFNEGQASETRDGIFSGSTGSPTAPAWIANLFFDGSFTAEKENDKIREQMASTTCVAVLTATQEGKAGWVDVGRACQRLSLAATSMGIAQAHLNQPVEVPQLRPRLAQLIGRPGTRPDLLIRLGYGPEMPRSLRRRIAEVVN